MQDSMLARLRERRAELGADKFVTRDVPGYDGDLAVRYKWVPYEQLAAKGQALTKVKNPTQRDLFAALDTLATLCVEVLVRDPEDPRADENGHAPLASVEDSEPIHFGDERLAEALAFKPGKAREQIRAMFGGNDYAIMGEAIALSAWLTDTSQEVDSDFSGN